jgi:hypothetical protein
MSTGDDSVLTSQLTLATRLTERSLRVMPGAFLPQSAETFTFDAIGGTRLYLRDNSGVQYFLRTVTADGIGVDLDRDGTYDYYALDFADAWVRGIPESALAFNRPFTAIDLLPGISGAAPLVWPDQAASIRIAGAWGWAVTPEAIVDFVVHITHDLRSAHQAGATFEIPAIDGTISLRDQTGRWLWRQIETEYGARIVAI